MFFAKLALLLLYYRMFSPNRWTKIAIYLGITINGLFYLTSSTAILILCIPRRGEAFGLWTYEMRCSRARSIGDVQGIFGLVSDLYTFILPLPVLCKLQISFKKKVGIIAIFLTGMM